MDKTWFVTGAGRGLGTEITRAALQARDNVFATARSAADVSKVFGPDSDRLHTASLDVTDQEAAELAAAHAVERFGKIDVLVNNAGQAQLGWFETIGDSDIRRSFNVNVFGTMNVTRAILPYMREKRAGMVVTITSINGLVANPGGSIYSATKFALEGWFEGLAQEVKPLGIKSLVIEPGMMRTEFLGERSMRLGSLDIADYHEAVKQFQSFIANAIHKQPGDPAKLAVIIVELVASASPPERFVFGDDALEWACAKLKSLRSDLDKSASFNNTAAAKEM